MPEGGPVSLRVLFCAMAALSCVMGCFDQPRVVRAPGQVAAAVDNPTITIIDPTNFQNYKLGDDTEGTAQVTIAFATNAALEIEAGSLQVGWYVGGTTALGTQDSVDNIVLDLHYGQHVVGVRLLDADGDPIDSPLAISVVTVIVSKNCETTEECTDNIVCNSSACLLTAMGGKECKFGAPPFAKCCDSDLSCLFGDTCDLETNTCGAPPEPPADDGPAEDAGAAPDEGEPPDEDGAVEADIAIPTDEWVAPDEGGAPPPPDEGVTPPPDEGEAPAPDEGTAAPPVDDGSTDTDDGGETPTTPGEANDGGCSAAPNGSAPPAIALLMLILLALASRRRV